MRKQIVPTRPLSDNENKLREKFYESITAQSELMDKLGERLLTLELAIPGLYATVLKLLHGDNATLVPNAALYITFGCWLLALLLTMLALTPKKWRVDRSVLKQDPEKPDAGLGVEDFFTQSALYKRRWLFASALFFFAGIFSAIFCLG